MEQHVKIVAVLQIVMGALGVLGAVLTLVFFGGMAGIVGTQAGRDAEQGAAVMGLLGVIFFVVVLVLSLPSLLAGVGLLKFREWARVLAIILSVLNLFLVPIGTAIGIYGLWALMNNETTALFKAKNAGG